MLTHIVRHNFRTARLRASNLVHGWRTTIRISHRCHDLQGQRSHDKSEPSWPNAVAVSLEAGRDIPCRPNLAACDDVGWLRRLASDWRNWSQKVVNLMMRGTRRQSTWLKLLRYDCDDVDLLRNFDWWNKLLTLMWLSDIVRGTYCDIPCRDVVGQLVVCWVVTFLNYG